MELTVYHWLVVAAVILALLLSGNRQGNTKYILLMCVLMFCVLGLRDCYTVGGDSTTTYLKSFNRIGEQEWNEITGKGENDLNIATSYLFKLIYIWFEGDYQWVIIILAAFEMLVLAHFLRRYSTNPVVSILCYFGLLFYTFMFSALKQSIAMAFVLLAFDGIMDRKLIRFLLCVLIASQFHFPALVFLPAYWIAKLPLNRMYFVTLGLLLLIVFLTRDYLVTLMTDIYENSIYDRDLRFLANKTIIMLFIVILGYVMRPPDPEDRVFSILIKYMGIAVVLQTFASYNNTFERLADYYFQFSVIFIPFIFQPQTGRTPLVSNSMAATIRRIGPILVCAFAVWRFLDIVSRPDAGYTPFYFYFNAPEPEELLSQIWRTL